MPPVTQGRIALPSRYRVVRHIANGGMASVWAAEDSLLERLLAVKVLAPGFAADPTARQRFTREARAAARVSDHPHVVTIYDVGEHDGQAFIVMEHLAGGTIADRLRQPQPVPRAAAMRWLVGAAAALDYAHSCDLVHRDVKPGNLLLDGAGRIAVADFGIARIASDTSMTKTGQVLGTAAYLSPEQALGKPATAASDRYALAVVAYELLAGRKPFTGELPAAQANQHIESPVPPASEHGNVPAAVDRVLERGLAKDPAARPLTATAFVEDLQGALVNADPPATTGVLPPRFRREPTPPPPSLTPTPTPAPPAAFPQRPRGPFLIALAALVFVLAAVIAAIAGGGGNGGNTTTPAAGTTAHKKAPAKHKAKAKTTPAKTTPAQTQTQAPAQTQTQAPPATTDKRALEAQGHSLIAQGNYPAAIDVLRRAVQNCPVSTTDPCAYALFDLGHALRLAGRPSEAIPVLQQRLQNPDQRAAVQNELNLAEAAANGDATPGKGNGKGKEKD